MQVLLWHLSLATSIVSICVDRPLVAGPRFLYRIVFQSEPLSLLSIKDLTPLLCCVSRMLNPPSVPLTKGEVTEEKASNLFAMGSTTNIRVVPSRDVAGITFRLSFALSMKFVVSAFLESPRTLPFHE